MNLILESQPTPHISPSWARYGVSGVRILEKIGRVTTAPHCIKYLDGVLLQLITSRQLTCIGWHLPVFWLYKTYILQCHIWPNFWWLLSVHSTNKNKTSAILYNVKLLLACISTFYRWIQTISYKHIRCANCLNEVVIVTVRINYTNIKHWSTVIIYIYINAVTADLLWPPFTNMVYL